MQTLPSPEYLDTMSAAKLLGLSASHLEKLRFFKKDGPRYSKFGRAVRYSVDDLRAWAAGRAQGVKQ